MNSWDTTNILAYENGIVHLNIRAKTPESPRSNAFCEKRYQKNGGNLYKICYTLKSDCRKNQGFDCCKAGVVWKSVGKDYRTLCIKTV